MWSKYIDLKQIYWYRFHKFWNFNPSSDVIITKIVSKRPKFLCLVQNMIHFDTILRWWLQSMGLEFQDFKKIVSQTNPSPQSSFYFWFLFFFQHWYMKYQFWPFSPKLGLMKSPRESKLQYFEKVISETNSSIQSSIKYRFWSFYHSRYMIYSCRPFLPNLKIMTTTKKHSRILKK